MRVEHTALAGVVWFSSEPHVDERGVFVETFRSGWAEHLPAGTRFVRDGQASNPRAGTVRGLHAQRGLGKLVRVAAGSVFDVIVDLRDGSPTWGRHVALTLSGDDGRVLFVPPGCAHGYATLTDRAVVCYRFTGGYVPGDELGVRWSDPALGIAWPEGVGVLVSDRDRALPLLAELR